MKRVTLVCMGNICRSPIAEVVLRQKLTERGVEDVEVDSAGTGGWHVGESMDDRALDILRRHGYDGSAHRARQFDQSWFAGRDLILVMDHDNLRAVRRIAPDDADVRLLRSFDPDAPDDAEVPDPYYNGRFEPVLTMVEAAADGVVEYLEDH
ncbi:low molecular weight phosphotyrosine protein phosphatase [Streptosporangiaceae bacterium NEAU-GS5]|nr:low molecular weight phosphotyrosine protein phosphatase [Streptosporangiaceae bacterium NEAU-GS5]